MEIVAAKVLISGRVQGVWYRGTTKEKALELGIRGWVKNLPTGDVEAFVEGDKKLVEAMIEWCRIGPPLAKVRSVDVTWTEPRQHTGFQIVR